MDEQTNKPKNLSTFRIVSSNINKLSDLELDKIVAKIKTIKKTRADKKKKQAEEEILKLAKKHGINVADLNKPTT